MSLPSSFAFDPLERATLLKRYLGQSFSNRPSPNRTCTFQRIRLSSETIVFERTRSVQFSASRVPFLSVSRSHLFPFPMYRALPRSLEYYGNSVAMSLSACRRSRIYARQTFVCLGPPFVSLPHSLLGTHRKEPSTSYETTCYCGIVASDMVCGNWPSMSSLLCATSLTPWNPIMAADPFRV